MKSSVKIVARFLLILTVINLYWKFTQCNSGVKKYGYIFTAPWVFDSDSTETVCLTLKGVVNANGRITVKLSNTNGIIAQTTKYIRHGFSECFDLKVPATSEKEAFLHIDGQFDGQSYSFRDRRLIKIRHAPDIIIIQPDKGIYNGGQKVQIRILLVTATFLPSTKKIRLIWIEDPLNVKVHEEKWPVVTKGMISSSLQLSDKPEIGNWTIFVEDQAQNRISKTFRVNKYVLPQFEIRVNIPPEIRPKFDSFIWEVCAKYTFGEAVKGQIRVNITRSSSQLSNGQTAPPMYLKNQQIDGCLSMRVNRNDLGFHQNNFVNYNLLNFHVEVTEHGTGIKLNNFQQKEVKVNPYKLYILSKQYFKPRLSHHFKLLVKDINDEPVKSDSFTLEVTLINLRGVEKQRYQQSMRTDSDGLAILDIKAFDDTIQTLILKITPTKNPDQTYEYFGFRHSSTKPIKIENSVTKRLRKWKSPSDSYIKIEGSKQRQPLECNHQSIFTVHCTGVNDDAVRSNDLTIFYQVMAKNNIIKQGTLSLRRIGQMKDETSSFKFDIPLRIEPKMSSKAEILVYYIRDDGEVVSDSETFIVDECFGNHVGMKFNSSKALPGANVNLELRASPNSLCSVFMTDKSTTLISGREFNPHKIFRVVNARPPNIPGPSADKQCTQIDPHLGIYERDKSMLGSQAAFDTIGIMTMTDLFLELNPCQPVPKSGDQGGRQSFSGSQDEDQIPLSDMSPDDGYIWVDREIDIRSSFPETWLWELMNIGGSGQASKVFPIPHTITDWTGSTFCMSPATGLGVSPRTSIVSDQPVFLTLDVPYSVRKGETVPVSASVHNHLQGCFPVMITLTTNSQDFVLKSSSSAHTMCVCGKQSNTHIYQIQPIKVGIINLSATVSAVSPQKSAVCSSHVHVLRVHAADTIIKSITVLPAGISKEAMQSYWICGNGGRNTFNYPLRMPSDGIKGTAKASVRVAGDLIAPTLGGLDHLVKLPSGCGEQNMVKFAPLVFVTSYLKSTNQLTTALKATTTAHLRSGYLNQLKWAHKDGAFSIWGKGQGNLRLTAYVIKSFVKAKSIAGVYIDPKFIQNGQNWIVAQQLSSGCFTQKGAIALGDHYEKTLELAVTIALLESGLSPTNSVITRAFRCIDKDAEPSNLRLAMKAYATALARKTNEAQQLLNNLEPRSIKSGDTEHWTNGKGSSHAINIETTSYVLLAIATLRAGYAAMAMNAIRWLIGQRTSVGGFSSTTDTVIAIQAIETFASQLSTLSTNLQVTLTNDKMGQVVVNVNQRNRLAEQTKPIVMADTLHVATTGQGCALLEIVIKYEIPALQTSTSFHLDVTILPYHLPTQQHKKTIRICTKYQGRRHRTNMVLIEIEMVTGYQADNGPLQKLQNSDKNLGKFENRPNKLVLYYDELKKDLRCFNVVVTRMLNAQNVKPAVIRVYDYSVPELSTTKQYTLL